MAKPTGPTNLGTQDLLIKLKKLANKEKVGIWKKVAEDLKRPARIRRQVNLYKIDQNLQEGETALVPGKVLSNGNFSKKATVAAWRFSAEAKAKINKTGKAISIKELMQENPKGKNVRIVG